MGNATESRLTGIAMFVVRHWLGILTVLTALFTLPIILVPWIESLDVPVLSSLAGIVFHLYGEPVCHQLPERSLFIFGYQMTVCARCFAIYFSFLAGCLLFFFIRRKLKPWNIFWYFLCCVPMAIDGTTQLFNIAIPRGIDAGWHLVWMTESTNELRIITGAIFGLASALYVLPLMQVIFDSDVTPPTIYRAPSGKDDKPPAK